MHDYIFPVSSLGFAFATSLSNLQAQILGFSMGKITIMHTFFVSQNANRGPRSNGRPIQLSFYKHSISPISFLKLVFILDFLMLMMCWMDANGIPLSMNI